MQAGELCAFLEAERVAAALAHLDVHDPTMRDELKSAPQKQHFLVELRASRAPAHKGPLASHTTRLAHRGPREGKQHPFTRV